MHVAGHGFAFKAGERLHTESSHKFSVESFKALAVSAGWVIDATINLDYDPANAVVVPAA